MWGLAFPQDDVGRALQDDIGLILCQFSGRGGGNSRLKRWRDDNVRARRRGDNVGECSKKQYHDGLDKIAPIEK